MSSFGNIRVLGGPGNLDLAERIAARLGLKLEPCKVSRFANQETA